MGRLVYHHKKATGVTYVYEITGEYWDKERKQMRNKQVCIGKLDPETGELIPSKRRRSEELSSVAVTASTSVIGPTLLLVKPRGRFRWFTRPVRVVRQQQVRKDTFSVFF